MMKRLTLFLRYCFGRYRERHLFVLSGVLFSIGILAGTAVLVERDNAAAAKAAMAETAQSGIAAVLRDDSSDLKWFGLTTACLVLLYTAVLRRVMLHREDIERELKNAKEAAEQANAARGAFLSTMSHEIRTPLNAVIGMAGLLRETPLDSTQEDFARAIESSANALLAIIDDVLDFSKIDAGKLHIDAVDCDLLALAEGSLDILAARARQKDLCLMSHVDPALPRTVLADPLRLRQVLLNLVGNAIKFTPSGEVRLGVSLLQRQGSTCTIRFEVVDTGIGIDPAKAGTLFTPFTQADNSVTREYGGTGLGLSISKRLVELMGGAITVESAPGAGSVFRFDLRLPVSGDTLAAPMRAQQDIRLLLAEPNGRQAAILASYLRAGGMQVTTASSAAEALALAWQASVRPSVVLASRLPDSDADAFATAMLARIPQVRLVFLASHEDAREDAAQHGFHTALLQPYRKAALFDAIALALDGRKPAAQSRRSALPPAANAGMEARHGNERILLVEDNVMNQQVAVRQLHLLGYAADVAGNGQEALDALAAFPYPLVLMDCQMPVMDGYETTRRIRAMERLTGRHTQIVAMTANAMRGDDQLCFDAGMDDYLAKPIVRERLTEMLARRLSFAPPPVADAPVPPMFNNTRFREMLGDDTAVRREMVELFVATTAPVIAKLGHAIAAEDWDEIRAHTHRLAGSCGNLGFDELAELARIAERACRTGDLIRLDTTHAAISLAFNRLCDFTTKEELA